MLSGAKQSDLRAWRLRLLFLIGRSEDESPPGFKLLKHKICLPDPMQEKFVLSTAGLGAFASGTHPNFILELGGS